jgi:hypothetical protein
MEHDLATLRALSARTRLEAHKANDPQLRQLLLDAAADYDRWAMLAENLAERVRE